MAHNNREPLDWRAIHLSKHSGISSRPPRQNPMHYLFSIVDIRFDWILVSLIAGSVAFNLPSDCVAQGNTALETLKGDETLEGDQALPMSEGSGGKREGDGIESDFEIPTATWVSLDENDSFTARIFDLGDEGNFRLQTEGVVFLTEVSGEFQFIRLNQTGRISFRDVAPGSHMITYVGPGRFLVSAVHVVERAESEEALFPNRIDLWCVNYGKREVDSIVLPYLTKGTSGARPEVDLAKVRRISEIRRSRVNGIDTIQDVQDIPSVYLVDGGISGKAYRPGTSSDGDQLLDPLPDADIVLVAEEDTYSSAKTDSEGNFRFNSVEPGAYALLCTSNGGITAIGMVVLPEKKDAMLVHQSNTRYVLQSGGGGAVVLQTAPNVAVLAASAAAVGSSSSSSSSAGQSATAPSGATAATTLSEISNQTEVPTLTNDEASPADPPTP